MDALGIDGWKLIVQLVAFLIFIVLLWRVALGPITKVLDERQQRIRESMEAAQQMQAELQATAVRNEEVLREARQEAQQIIGNAREAADATIARSREEASKPRNILLARKPRCVPKPSKPGSSFAKRSPIWRSPRPPKSFARNSILHPRLD
jgi:F-type H+-transporting ATPase subunit b